MKSYICNYYYANVWFLLHKTAGSTSTTLGASLWLIAWRLEGHMPLIFFFFKKKIVPKKGDGPSRFHWENH